MPIELRYIAGMKQDAMSTTFRIQQISIRFWINFTESECLRLERTCGGHLAQPPPLKWDHLEPVAQDCVQTAFEYLLE